MSESSWEKNASWNDVNLLAPGGVRPARPWFILRALIRPHGVLIRPVALIRPAGPWSVLKALVCPAGPCSVQRAPIHNAEPRYVPRGPDSSCRALIHPVGPLSVLRAAGPTLSHESWSVPRGPETVRGMHQGPLSLGPEQTAYLSYGGRGSKDMLAPVDLSLMVANGHGPNAPPPPFGPPPHTSRRVLARPGGPWRVLKGGRPEGPWFVLQTLVRPAGPCSIPIPDSIDRGPDSWLNTRGLP